MKWFEHPWLLGCAAFLVFLTSVCWAQNAQTFTNPLLSSGPDPYLTTHEGLYYLTYTTASDIRVRQVESLARVSEAEETVIWTDAAPGRCCNIWAPELHRLDGPSGPRWYVYYTAGPAECCAKQRMHVLESQGDDPLGPYTYKGKLFDPEHDFWAIDATVFKTEDGSSYVAWSGTPRDNMPYEKPQHLYLARLLNPWTLQGPRAEISRPDLAWEQNDGPVNEGPAILQRGGRIFLAYSGSTCWTDDYATGMLIADEGSNLLEPDAWQKLPEPLITRDDEARAFGPGHGTFFKSPDGAEDWFVYHANPVADLGCGDLRAPRAQKITWGEDGLPRFFRPSSPETQLPLPSGDPG